MLFCLLPLVLLILNPATALTCQDPPLNSYPYCNVSLSIGERVNDLLSRMTLNEKINMTNSDQGGIPRLAVPSMGHTECTHGTTIQGGASPLDFPTTSFPQAISMAQAFDRDMLYRVARAISNEVRAKYNRASELGLPLYEQWALVCWAPVVNVCRDPRWGRCQEGYGEDPLLQGELATQYVTGLQWDPDVQGGYWQAVATCKHFDVHSGPENWDGFSRASFDSMVSYRDWIETFQPGFKACVQAGVGSLMCSYNEINGIPACSNSELLIDLLRSEWGFEGFVVSDCGAVPQIYSAQHSVRNYVEASDAAFKSGMDWYGICGGPPNMILTLKQSFDRSMIRESVIDSALKRFLPFIFKLGLMDPPANNPWLNLNLTQEWYSHRSLAKEVAERSIVLLKNDDAILPLLLSDSALFPLALIGPCANNSICLKGDYDADPPVWQTPLIAFTEALTNVTDVLYAAGCADTACSTTGWFDEAITVAGKAKTVLFIGGISSEQESEGHDRTQIELPSNQSLLYKKVLDAMQPNTTLICLLAYGAPVIDLYMFSTCSAILGVGYAGEMGGSAMYDTVFGMNNPSARTSVTFYQNTGQLPNMTDYNMSRYPGRTYRFFQEDAAYPFAFGLSYTQFEYSDMRLSANSISACEPVTVSVDFKNTGGLKGDETTLVFLRVLDPPDGVITDQIRLANFTKSYNVSVGESRNVVLSIAPQRMTVTQGYDYKQVVNPGKYMIFVGSRLTVDKDNSGHQIYPTLINTTLTVNGNCTLS